MSFYRRLVTHIPLKPVAHVLHLGHHMAKGPLVGQAV